MKPPLVSVVIATYGRPEVLRWAIESVRRQTLTDWELLIVGDACDQATVSIVQAQANLDARIRFINLHSNHGEQSGPNNVGIARSHGRYIAFLNQDDLWFDDHLAQLVDWIEGSGSDLVYGLSVHILPDSRHPADRPLPWLTELVGLGHEGRYDPLATFAPASAWLMRRECPKRIGPWRPALHCRTESSQDFLFRAWRAGLQLTHCPVPTVLVFSSGVRPGSYMSAADDEQAYFTERLQHDPALRNLLLATTQFRTETFIGRQGMRMLQRQCLTWLARRGFHPRAWYMRRHGARQTGGYIRKLRGIRGLRKALLSQASASELKAMAVQTMCACEPGQAIEFQAGTQAWRHQGQGWHALEPSGSWTAGPCAELLLRPPNLIDDVVVRLTLSPFVTPQRRRQRLTVLVNEQAVFSGSLEGNGSRDITLPLASAHWGQERLLHIKLQLPDAISHAKAVPGSADHRQLGIMLHRLTLEGGQARTARP